VPDDFKVHDPKIFTGVGLKPVPGHEAQAEPRIKLLERTVNFDRRDTPWMMAEFVCEVTAADKPEALDFIRKTLAVHIGMSDLHCPTAPDPEVPVRPDFPHPFLVGPSADPLKPEYLLSGTVNDRFLAAWRKYGRIYFELHVWVRRGEVDESTFMWCVLGNDSPLRVIVTDDEPTIVTLDAKSGYRCLYAQKKGWTV
jgi:hypothetical protein